MSTLESGIEVGGPKTEEFKKNKIKLMSEGCEKQEGE